jgi:hypothetical protein
MVVLTMANTMEAEAEVGLEEVPWNLERILTRSS